MRCIHAGIDNTYDHGRTATRGVPSFGGIDISVVGGTELAHVVEAGHVAKVRIVGQE